MDDSAVMKSDGFFLFNTANSISSDARTAAFEAVRAQALRFEKLFSRTDPESALFRVNEAGGARTEVDPELAALTRIALSYCRDTDGLFDITMGSAVRLWDFKQGALPGERELAEALTHVDWRGVTVDECGIALADPRASIDLGGIAKGYIADRFRETLAAGGARHSLVNLGGNVAVSGGKPDGSPWRIGIRKPLPSWENPQDEPFALLEFDEGSVVTSGVYERAFVRDGRAYHHILDPATGYPAETDLLSATVVSRDSIDGDGYTTALVIMGADRAIEFAQNHPRIEAVLLTCEGDVLATSGIGSDVGFRIVA